MFLTPVHRKKLQAAIEEFLPDMREGAAKNIGLVLLALLYDIQETENNIEFVNAQMQSVDTSEQKCLFSELHTIINGCQSLHVGDHFDAQYIEKLSTLGGNLHELSEKILILRDVLSIQMEKSTGSKPFTPIQ